MNRNIAGSRIRAARAMHNPKLTQDELVAQMYIKENLPLTANMISRMETGDRYITDQELVAFSRVLQVSTAWLLGETSDPTEKTAANSRRGPARFSR